MSEKIPGDLAKQGRQAMPLSSRPQDQQQAIRVLFQNHDFRLLWAGQLLSMVGDQCLLIAAITLISNLSRSPLAMLVPAVAQDCLPLLMANKCVHPQRRALCSVDGRPLHSRWVCTGARLACVCL